MLGINSKREPIKGEAATRIREASASMAIGKFVASETTRKAIKKAKKQYHVVWK